MKRFACIAASALAMIPSIAHAQTISPADAGAPQAPSGQRTCAPDNEVALRAEITNYVARLKIANYQADAALMESAFSSLEAYLGSAGSCPEGMKVRLCDADCFYQRGNVYLFRATGFPLLSSKGSNSPSDGSLDNGTLLAQAADGITLLDSAIDVLARQQTPAPAGAPPDPAADPFQNFLKSLAQLNALKAKLYVAAGDIYYRMASTSHLQNMSFAVAKALGDIATPDGTPGTEFYQASTYYDAAFWLVMDAKVTIPDADGFVEERASLAAVERDVSLRLDSVRKGYLYIGIDPDELTTKGIDELGRVLYTQKIALDDVEQRISQLTSTWAQNYQNEQSQEFDVKNLQNSQAIDLELYKIAQVEQSASLLMKPIEDQAQALGNSISTFELQQRINGVQADLTRTKLQMAGQLQSIQGEQVQDLLALDQQNVRDGMDKLRFDIDMTIAAFNFDMQYRSLQLQVQELENRKIADNNDRAIRENMKAQLQREIDLDNARIANAQILIDKAAQTQATYFMSSRVPILNEICATNAELALYTGAAQGYSDPVSGQSCSVSATITAPQPTVIAQLCQARQQLLTVSNTDIKAIQSCLTGGGSCGTTPMNAQQAYQAIYAQQKAVLDGQRATFNSVKSVLDDRVAQLNQTIAARGVIRDVRTAAEVAATAAAVAAAIPPSETGMVGIFPTELVDITGGIADAAKVVAETACKVVDWTIQDQEFLNVIDQEMASIKTQLAQLNGEMNNIDNQDLLNQYEQNRALAELSARMAETQLQFDQNTQESAVQTIDCQNQQNIAASATAKLQAQKAALIAQLQTLADQSALVKFDIDEQENLKSQSQIDIQRINLQIAGVNLEETKIDQDIASLNGMEASLQKQLDQVVNYEAKVGNLQDQYTAKTQELADVKARIAAETNTIFADKVQWIQSVIDNETNIAFSQVADLKAEVAQYDTLNALQQQISSIDSQMQQAVRDSRNKIVTLASQAPASGAPALFWDYQKVQASLTRGAPEFIEHKRRLLESINYTYNLYRNRYDMLTEFSTTAQPLSSGQAQFIGTSADLEQALASCGTTSANARCDATSLTWDATTLNGLHSEFTLESSSGLVTELLQNGRARFEISPAAGNKANSRNLGNFVLWDSDVMTGADPMLLLHIVASVQSPGCESLPTMTVQHLGSGILFERLSQDSAAPIPSLIVKRPVQADLTLFADGSTSLGSPFQEYAKFANGPYTAEQLEAKLHDDTKTYPYAGLPLIATYELIASPQLVACMSSGSPTVKLGFIFAQRGNNQK